MCALGEALIERGSGVDSSDPAGLQASLGAAEGDKQASVVVDIALP